MAKDDRKQIGSEVNYNELYDNDGNLLFNVSMRTDDYEQDGSVVTERTAEHFEGADGTIITQADMMRPSPQTRLKKCDACAEGSRGLLRPRRPAAMPYAPAPTIQSCCRCRRNVCRRHYHTSSRDGRIRCNRCHWLHRFIEPLFFRYKV